MEDIYYIFWQRPRSYNGRSKRKSAADYRNERLQDFQRNFEGLYTGPIYRDEGVNVMVEILYFERIKFQKTDIDNISKPLIDAFRSVLYKDDEQVVRRIATKVNAYEYTGQSLDVTDFPPEIVALYNKWKKDGKEHITIMKVSDIDLNKFGGKLI